MKLARLIERLDVAVTPARDIEISMVTDDSRAVRPGGMFVAVRGHQCDGHRFIPQVLAQKAAAIVVDAHWTDTGVLPEGVACIRVKDTREAASVLAGAWYDHPSDALRVVGVTGTNGKTTVTYLLERIWEQQGLQAGVIGTIECRYARQAVATCNTTPGAFELQRILRQMKDAGCARVAMEVSSHGLAQGRVGGMHFSAAVFTNLTQDHLDYHKDMHAYAGAKAMLFEALASDADALVNSDDPHAAYMAQRTRAVVTRFSVRDNAAEVHAQDVRMDAQGVAFMLVCGNDSVMVRAPLLGMHNVSNILAAAAVAWREGVPLATVSAALKDCQGAPGRLERVKADAPFTVLVDYAHTDDALRNVLRALRPLARGRLLVVFGCGGERDRGKRPKMAAAVTELADYAVVTNDNPRREDPAQIIRDIVAGCMRDNYRVEMDRAAAIRAMIGMARAGDIVLIAGKGHETYQITGTESIHFDDREVAAECLRSMRS